MEHWIWETDHDSVFLRRVIINQVLPDSDAAEDGVSKFLDNVRSTQSGAINQLTQLSTTSNVPLIKVPYFEMEVKSTYGLKFVGNFIFQ